MSALDSYKTRSGLSDSESDDYDSEAEEERLNKLYGAADEVKVRGRKGDAERDSNGNADGEADAELQAEVQKKRKRPKLELGDKGLLSSRGLVAVHRSFPPALSKLSGRGKEGAFAKAYAAELRRWANGLFAGLNWEDVLMRVEGAGGKEDVKAHLNLMREGARKEGLEKR